MTHSGPAGSPEGDGALPTRREARAQRVAAEASDSPAIIVPVESVVVPAEVAVVPTDTVVVPAEVAVVPVESAAVVTAVPVPPVAILSVSPDLAVIVGSTTTSAVEPSAPSAPVAPRPGRPGRYRPFSAASAPATAPAGARTSPAKRPVKRRKQFAKMVTLLAIPAIFLTAALPAYAFSPQGGSAGISAKAPRDTQDLTVAAAAAAVSISTDGFTATSQAELDEIEANIEADLVQKQAAEDVRTSAAEYAVVGIRAEGDDYPWRDAATESQGGGFSPLGYYYRECVDFVAWRLNRDAGATGPFKWTWSTMTPGGGNASAWANAWSSKGWASSKSPVVGAVAWFTYNHVAYVQSVPGDGTVVLEEYNWNGSHAYHTRTVPISEVPVYLYPPT
ncbi:CHAP domain-containing protein [Cryobacterium sp. N22]|uniref:CHAP domain-containing protein n=1 Tax=Cryobacterium sp. N22 TaxID=2048290 RepID=UPI000CE46575|nr:CHAP domain-containing protein [Cryobacterium sp. N22]